MPKCGHRAGREVGSVTKPQPQQRQKRSAPKKPPTIAKERERPRWRPREMSLCPESVRCCSLAPQKDAYLTKYRCPQDGRLSTVKETLRARSV